MAGNCRILVNNMSRLIIQLLNCTTGLSNLPQGVWHWLPWPCLFSINAECFFQNCGYYVWYCQKCGYYAVYWPKYPHLRVNPHLCGYFGNTAIVYICCRVLYNCTMVYCSVQSCTVLCSYVEFCTFLYIPVHSCTLSCTFLYTVLHCQCPVVYTVHSPRRNPPLIPDLINWLSPNTEDTQ